MRVHLVRIGNSRGIRIPKAVLDELGLDGLPDLISRSSKLILSRVRKPREGWEEAAAKMASRGDDRLVHGEQLKASSWDEKEWEW